MNVALIDLDMMKDKRHRAFPNLALMKLSAWHKRHKDKVSLNFPLQGIDMIYAACVFTWHRPKELAEGVWYGGSGIGNYERVLPSEAEHIMPDYSLYPSVDWSMGYTSRGCIRDCQFCKVRIKEGYIQATAEPAEFYNPQFGKMVLLDNNILASPNCLDTLSWLIEKNLLVDINQGLDIRCLNEEIVHYLMKLRVRKYRFAFDDISYQRAIEKGILMMDRAGISRRKLSFYVLVGFNPEDHAMERMRLLQSYDVDVYPMIYKGEDGREPRLNIGLTETVPFHGARGNIRKFLRLAGRLA